MGSAGDDFGTLHEAKIEKIWGLCAGSFVYEGCGALLSDGRPCALGKNKRRLRRRVPGSPFGPNSRGRVDHDCCTDGWGIYMYCFAIKVGDVVMQVNESYGKQLMGKPGQAYKETCENDETERTHLCETVMASLWDIGHVKDRSGQCLHRALNVNKCLDPLVDVGSSEVTDADSGEVTNENLKGTNGTQWFAKLKEALDNFL